MYYFHSYLPIFNLINFNYKFHIIAIFITIFWNKFQLILFRDRIIIFSIKIYNIKKKKKTSARTVHFKFRMSALHKITLYLFIVQLARIILVNNKLIFRFSFFKFLQKTNFGHFPNIFNYIVSNDILIDMIQFYRRAYSCKLITSKL